MPAFIIYYIQYNIIHIYLPAKNNYVILKKKCGGNIMKFPLNEAEKNFFVCAALMLVVGLSFILFMDKVTMCIAIIALGVAFAIGGIAVNIRRDPDEESNDGEKDK